MEKFINYYEVLGIDRNANLEEINSAYKNKINLADETSLNSINEAYEILINATTRDEYNEIYDEKMNLDNKDIGSGILAKIKSIAKNRVIPWVLMIAIAVGGKVYASKLQNKISDLESQIDADNETIIEQTETLSEYKETLDKYNDYSSLINFEGNIYEEKFSGNLLIDNLKKLNLYVDNPTYIEYIELIQSKFRDYNVGFKIENKYDENGNYYSDCNIYQIINLTDGKEIKISIANIKKFADNYVLTFTNDEVTRSFIFSPNKKSFIFNCNGYSYSRSIQYLPGMEDAILTVSFGEYYPLTLTLKSENDKKYLIIQTKNISQTIEIRDFYENEYSELYNKIKYYCEKGEYINGAANGTIYSIENLLDKIVTSLEEKDNRIIIRNDIFDSFAEMTKIDTISDDMYYDIIPLKEVDSSLINLLKSKEYIKGEYLTNEVKEILSQLETSYYDKKFYYHEVSETLNYMELYILNEFENDLVQYENVFEVAYGYDGLTLTSYKEKGDFQKFLVRNNLEEQQEKEYSIVNFNEYGDKVHMYKSSCESCKYEAISIYYPKEEFKLELYNDKEKISVYYLIFNDDYKMKLTKNEYDKLYSIMSSYCKYGKDTYSFIWDYEVLVKNYIKELDVTLKEQEYLYNIVTRLNDREPDKVLTKNY